MDDVWYISVIVYVCFVGRVSVSEKDLSGGDRGEGVVPLGDDRVVSVGGAFGGAHEVAEVVRGLSGGVECVVGWRRVGQVQAKA